MSMTFAANNDRILSAREVVDRIAKARAAGMTGAEVRTIRDCPFCGRVGTLDQTCVVATGLPIVYPAELETPDYQPEVGEVLRNRYMWCRACKADQGS